MYARNVPEYFIIFLWKWSSAALQFNGRYYYLLIILGENSRTVIDKYKISQISQSTKISAIVENIWMWTTRLVFALYAV